MRRIYLLTLLVAAATLVHPNAASAGTIETPKPGVQVIQRPGYVGGDMWVDSSSAFRAISRPAPCKYPQEFWDVVMSLNEDGEWVADEENGFYRYVEAVDFNIDRFGTEIFAAGSCWQHIWVQQDTCTDEERIGVRAILWAYDALLEERIWPDKRSSAGEPGLPQGDSIADTACLEISTREDFMAHVRGGVYLTKPSWVVNPHLEGLTGLDTWFWYEVPTGFDPYVDGFRISIPTAANRWLLDVDVWLQDIAFDPDGDGTWDHIEPCSYGGPGSLVDCAGSERHPVYTHMYEVKGTYPATVQTRWAGTALDPYGTLHTLDPSYLVAETVQDYQVVEIRAVLIDP